MNILMVVVQEQVYYHELNLILIWISQHMLNKVWDEITYSIPNVNDCTVEVTVEVLNV